MSIGSSSDANDPTITLNSIAGGINPIPAFLSRIVQPSTSASLTRADSADCGTGGGDALGWAIFWEYFFLYRNKKKSAVLIQYCVSVGLITDF